MIHFHDRSKMAYTVCWRLPSTLETTTEREEVTCPGCLFPRDAGGRRVLPNYQVLMPNGKAAVVTETVTLPLPEVVVIFRGQQVNIPAAEVVLL